MNDAANKPLVRPAIKGSGPAPTVAVGNAAQLGTGPAAAFDATATYMGGELTVTPGTTPSAFAANTPIVLATLTIPAGVFTNAPYCTIDPSNQLAAQAECGALTAGTQSALAYYDRAASTGTSLVFKMVPGSGGTPTLSNAAYKFIVSILGA